MPPLVAFVVRNFANGFLAGAAAVLAMIVLDPSSTMASFASESALGLWLIVFSLGSPLGMGSLATALWFGLDADDPD